MKEQIIELIKNNSPEEATDKILKLVVKAGVSSSAIERAKIVATKRLKMVVDTAIHEYEKAEKNGRCDECQEPLTFLEAKDGKTCEDCLCPA
jgi:Zn finger protein HypA/HybF involved in hydrogenase expression